MTTEKPPILIDLGSGHVKAGFAGEPGPRLIFPTLVGRPRTPGAAPTEPIVGAQAEQLRATLQLTSPIDHGFVADWDDLARVLDHTFRALGAAPGEHEVLVTEPPLNPKHSRERLTALMFDTFGVAGLYIGITSVLSLYAVGKFTGLVVEIGDRVTHIVPIFDGYALPHSTLRMHLAGSDITDDLLRQLHERGQCLPANVAREVAQDIKERACLVALEGDAELSDARPVPYVLPNGGLVQLGAERSRAPEILFKPSLIGKQFAGLHEQVYQSIAKSDVDVRKDLYQNIILGGGTSLLPGLPERLAREIQRLAPKALAGLVKVFAAPDRQYTAWRGASILSTISTFGTMWITRDEYDDAGPTIVHRKCF